MCHLEGLRILYGLSSCVSVLLAALSQACLSIHKEAFKPDCNFLFIGEVVLRCPARPSNLISSRMLPQLQSKNKKKKRKSQDRNHSRLRLAFTQPLALPKPEVATLSVVPTSLPATCSLSKALSLRQPVLSSRSFSVTTAQPTSTTF
jgi:hypothetical protein